jgi:hypothetical protein
VQSPSFASSVAKNQGHACSLNLCSLPRAGLNRWCSRHTAQANRYGHPNAGPLHPKQWATQRSEVAALFVKNASHPGQRQALDVVAGLLAQASANEQAFRGAEELARLARHGVQPLAVLTELCAVVIFLQAKPLAVPDDRSFDFAVSSAVFKLAPRTRRFTRKAGTPWPVTREANDASSYSPKARPSALANIGRLLRQSLAPLLSNVQLSLQSREAQRVAFEAAMKAPFNVI